MTESPTRSPLLEIAVTLLIPSLILMQFSKPEHLGAADALVLALAFPFGWDLRELARSRRFSLFAGLGIVSLLLIGGIGQMELDIQWLAVKEAAIPGMLGLIVAGSALTRMPLVRVLLDTGKIDAALTERGNLPAFETRLRGATWIVTSPAGSAAFNEELGRLGWFR